MLDHASSLEHSDNYLRDVYCAFLLLVDVSHAINIYVCGELDDLDPCAS